MSDLPTPAMTIRDVAGHLHVSCEIRFTCCFCQAKPLRTPGAIHAGILVLDRDTNGLAHEIVGARTKPAMYRASPAGG